MHIVLLLMLFFVLLGVGLAIKPIREVLLGIFAVIAGAVVFAVGVILWLWPIWVILLIVYVVHHFAVKYW